MLDKKTFVIGVLSLSAVILLVANILAPHHAMAVDTIVNNDYSLSTCKAIQGGDNLYITDNHTGQMAVFAFNPNRRTLEPVDVKIVQSMFTKLLNTTGTGAGNRPPRTTR